MIQKITKYVTCFAAVSELVLRMPHDLGPQELVTFRFYGHKLPTVKKPLLLAFLQENLLCYCDSKIL